MDIQALANDLKERGLIRMVDDKLQKRSAALTAEEAALVEQNTPEILSALTGRPVTDFVEFETVVHKPPVEVPSLDVQFGNYENIWLAGKGGAIGLANHYYSPARGEFDLMKERTRLLADQNGGKLRLHYNFAHSWDAEIMSGPNVGMFYRIDRRGRINGVDSK